MNTVDRLKCPACGLPTIPDDGHNTPDMALCNFCYEQEDLETMSTHTPGPWNCKSSHYRGFSAGIVRDAFNDPVADCRYSEVPQRDKKTPEQIDANARLIASAPDLLQMVRNLVDLASVRGRLDGYKSLLADARALIARAEGKD